ncbi:MAG TPA: N-acetyl-gamma-glutamyl-phosphate reductase [Kofleriaceae bacterium]|nr:N-acetyl-gamma-glutamyl-phosphate reductase [Kofleriaceae bacterium]
MQRPRIAVIGASGYSGIELVRLLLSHDGVELVAAGSDKWAGRPVEGAQQSHIGALSYAAHDVAASASADVFMLATPAEVSHELAPKLLARNARVVDLSGAFRLRDAAAYATHYGFEHRHAGLLAEAVYGLPELDRSRQRDVRLIANPGCYATAIQLALSPIRRLSGSQRFIVDAMSGVTGAGRKAVEEFSFAEIASDVRAYRVLRHQHTPEIEQQLQEAVTFVPHLLPIKRGILATCHAQLVDGTTADDVARAFGMFEGERFIELAKSADDVAIKDVVGTNKCRIGFSVGARGELVVISAIDNLVKGAAGQAVQNLNLMLGLPESAGLAGLRSFHP